MSRFCIKCGLPFFAIKGDEELCYPCLSLEDLSHWIKSDTDNTEED